MGDMGSLMTMNKDKRTHRRVRNQQVITDRYGEHWLEVIRKLYLYHDSLEDVVADIGITKPTLYKWGGRATLNRWKLENRAATAAYLQNTARAILDE